MNEFNRVTNAIEHWARVEEICDFFGVEVPDLAGKIYVRSLRDSTLDEEIKWLDLRDISEDRPEGFGVKVDWG